MDDNFDEVTSLRTRLAELQAEHRDLDKTISLQVANPTDQLAVRRLKKRKLALKDRIALIERLLEPDELA